MKRLLLYIATALVAAPCLAETSERDSLRTYAIGEIVIASDPKTTGSLSEQPFSYSELKADDMEQLGIRTVKDAALFVPNLFMPDYGSKLTSAIYIRGIGSRINTPAVGLYVDDVAYTDKSAFDFDFLGVERMEVLRGPQSTLYGRNAMGGLIKIYTRNPQQGGTEIKLGGSTRDYGRYAQFLTSHSVTPKTSFSIGGFYKANEGYNRNVHLDRRSNGGESGGGKFRWLYDSNEGSKVRHSGLLVDFQTSLEYSNENGYDYYEEVRSKEIVCGELGSYRRTLLNTSLKMEMPTKNVIFTSVTNFQHIGDRMFMDQDFSPASIFTLEQRQHSNSIAEEFVMKNNGKKKVDWTAGAYIMHQSLNTNAPVHFGADGIQSLIQSGIDKGFAAANAAMNPMGMSLAMKVTDKQMAVGGDFDTPVFNSAAFGQITVNDLFTEGLDLTAGIRLDYEHTKMKYNSGATSNFNFLMSRNVQGRPIPLYNYDLTTESRYEGSIKNDYTQLLPKLALTYHFDRRNMVYASVSKGFRSGGYNIQMFSDLIQTSLQNDMMRTLAEKMPMVSNFMPIKDNPSADSTTVFKPEISWNYEAGTHLSFLNGRLTADAAVFFVDTRDQQIARYAASGLGRQMVNAGRSQSYGVDLSVNALMYLFNNPLTVNASYGYTHATFKDYDGGQSKGESYVYDGNYVPFAPLHNFAVAADYTINFNDNLNGNDNGSSLGMRSISFGANLTGAGRTYWTEKNDVSQPLYTLLGAHITADFGLLRLNLWGKNLTQTDYVPFYFESMGKGFAQTCRPMQLGVDVSIRF